MERALSSRPDVLLHAASGPDVGLGHVVRTAAVALALEERGGRALVVVEDDRSLARVRGLGLSVVRSGEQTGTARAAWLDGFRDWSDVCQRQRRRGARVLLCENRTAAREHADLVVHPSLHFTPDAWERTRPERVRGGPAWIPLRPEVLAEPRRAERPIDLLVTFGGADPKRCTERVLEALGRLAFHGRVLAVVGPHMAEREAGLAARSRDLADADVSRGESGLAARMAESGAAVTALGTTLYELAFLGVRALVLANWEEDRAALAFYRAHGPHRPLGLADALSDDALDAALAAGLAALRDLPPPAIPELGAGADRIAAELLS